MDHTSIPPRFRFEVELHLVRNLDQSGSASGSLILGIHGPPGEGKTYQTEYVLRQANVEMILISGGQLESGTAGEPSAILRTAYREASAHIEGGKPAAVLMNDADAAIGSWGEMTQYTVNTQNTITELMHLADYPHRVENSVTQRVPIILTGNDFTRLYGPLCRPGRMDLFEWKLSDDERVAVICSIFPGLTTSDAVQLVGEYPDYHTAFWSSVKISMNRYRLARLLERHDLGELLVELVNGTSISPEVDLSDLEAVRKAADRTRMNEATNHLAEGRV